ncbi:hypothetical protein AC1031_005914 [Aphanomyces cochlioides]|nr:hypothetical protein AC1031_005914 [Aphanomyces cochlioides]
MFPSPPLTHHDKQTFIQLAEQTAREVAKCSNLENGPINWKQRVSEDNLVVYEGLDAAVDRVSCAKSDLQATIEEVQMMTFAESSEDYKLQAQMFNTGVIDAARLYNLVLPTDKAPLEFVGINWMLQKGPSKGLRNQRPRDWCFIEGHFEIKVDGRRGWIRVFKSIHLASCPDLKADSGYVRGHYVRAGILFVETDRPGLLQVTQYNHEMAQGDSKPKMFDFLSSSSGASKYRKIRDFEAAILKYRLTKATFLPKSMLVDGASRTYCLVCIKPFAKEKKLNCRKCGEVVCRHCSKIYELKVNNQWGEIRVCDPCVWGGQPRIKSQHESKDSLREDMSSTWDSDDDQSPDVPILESAKDDLRSTFSEIMTDSMRTRAYKPAMAAKFDVQVFFSAVETSTPLAPPRPRNLM